LSNPQIDAFAPNSQLIRGFMNQRSSRQPAVVYYALAGNGTSAGTSTANP